MEQCGKGGVGEACCRAVKGPLVISELSLAAVTDRQVNEIRQAPQRMAVLADDIVSRGECEEPREVELCFDRELMKEVVY